MQTMREQPYKEIWSEAVIKVAAKYGASDNSIRKRCRRYKIPTPNNKYWGDFRSGKNPASPPLPDFDGDSNIEFQGSYSADCLSVKESKPYAQPKELFESYPLTEKDKYSAIHQLLEMKFQLRNPHLLIVRHMETTKQLKKKKPYAELIGIRGINAYGYDPSIDTHSVSE